MTDSTPTTTESQVDNIRALVRGLYQTQKLRIETGNRIGANFRRKLGIEEGDEPDEEQEAILDRLRESYRRITDGIAEVTRRPNYEFDALITNYTELRLVDHYTRLEKEENRIIRDIKNELKGIPIYDEFLRDVKGVGPTMAGVLIAELDPHKAPYPSSFWRYAGLDVVHVWYLIEKNGQRLDTPVAKEPPEKAVPMSDSKMVVTDEEGNATRVYEQRGEGRSRKKEHLVEVEYENSEGEIDTRKSLGYNPFVKTKLMGVLGPSFLRTGSDYRDHYDRYRHRKENDPSWSDASDGHLHQASLRYMVKQFLLELHLKWRSVEGLTVPPPYHKAKQGRDDHGLEEKLGIEYDWDEYPDRSNN